MAWVRKGDNAATAAAVLAIETDPDWDDRLVNEAYGFWQRLVEHSASHMTDGVLDLGAAITFGGRTRWEALTRVCVRSGLLTVERRGKAPTWRIMQDTDIVHLRSRAELEWEKARKLDTANPRLIVEVKLRDGDACRYCGVIVQWRARRGGRRGSYDHRPPGQRAASPEQLVVCCFECNGRRSDRSLAEADALVPLRAAPATPFYSAVTVAYLAAHGVTVQPSDPSQQPQSSSHQARSAGAAPGADQQPTGSSHQALPGAVPAAGSADPAETSKSEGYRSGRDGSGLDGPGLGGSGRDGAGAQPEPAPPRSTRRRGSRGRRGKGQR